MRIEFGDVHIHVHCHTDPAFEAKLDEVLAQLKTLTRSTNVMSVELDALTSQVATNTSVEAGAVTLIEGIAARITAAGTDPAALAALTAELNTSSTALAAAVVANTPTA